MLAGWMRRSIHDEVWDRLAAEGYVDDWAVAQGTETEHVALREMGERVRALVAAGAPKPPHRSQLANPKSDRRLAIISDLCAAEARKRADVQEFRAEVLADGLTSVEAISAWIKARAPDEGGAAGDPHR